MRQVKDLFYLDEWFRCMVHASWYTYKSCISHIFSIDMGHEFWIPDQLVKHRISWRRLGFGMPPGPTYLSGEPISAWFDVCYCHVAAALKFGPLPENLTSARAPGHAWCLKMFSFPELGCFIFVQVGTARLREGFQRLCNVLPSSTKQHPEMTRVYSGLIFNVWPYESGKLT